MATAKIRVNPERTLVEIEADGVTFEPEEYPEDGFLLTVDPDTGVGHIAVVEEISGLAAGVYRLSLVSTDIEEGVEFEEDEDDDGDVLVAVGT